MALPVYVCTSKEDAAHVQRHLCKLTYEGEYIIPGFEGNIEALKALRVRIDEIHKDWVARGIARGEGKKW